MPSVFDGLPDVFTGTFGQAVTVTPADGGDAYEITAIVRRRAQVDPMADFGAVVTQSYLSARSEDVTDLLAGDGITIAGTAYVAAAPVADGRGMTQIPIRTES